MTLSEMENWESLAALPEEAQQREIRQLYEALVPMTEEERRAEITNLVRQEYALPDVKLQAVTAARLRAWLAMEPDAAKTVALSYDAVMNTMPGPLAMRRVTTVQTLSFQMYSEEVDRLRELIPSVIRQIPHLTQAKAAPLITTSAMTSKETPATRRPWWAFWKRGDREAMGEGGPVGPPRDLRSGGMGTGGL